MECISKLWRLQELGLVMRPQKSNSLVRHHKHPCRGTNQAASLPGVNSDGCIHRSVVRNDVSLQVPQKLSFCRVLTTINWDHDPK